MAVKSLSISDQLLEKVTRELKQKGISFSELVCQRLSKSYEPPSTQKSDQSAEKILAKLDSLNTNLRQIFNALREQNSQTDIEIHLNQKLDIFKNEIGNKISILDSSIENQTKLFRDLQPKLQYIDPYNWGDTVNHIIDHFFTFSSLHLVNIFYILLLMILGGIVFLIIINEGWNNKIFLVLAVVPTYYLILHRIMKNLITKDGWHQKQIETVFNNKKQMRR